MSEMTLARTDMRDMRSRTGRSYRIFVLKPDREPPPSGFPVLYLLDGNATFPTAAICAALQARRPQTTGVGPALVVGIGYPVDDYLDATSRTYDYTPLVEPDELPRRPDGSAWPPHGGADAFLNFIETDLKPALGREFAIDASRQAIFGHSFGGLFVLHALFTQPRSFRFYIAASPSIWFAKSLILAQAESFVRQHHEDRDPRDLLVTVGSLERAATTLESPGANTIADKRWLQQNRMVDNARDMAAQLSAAEMTALNVAFKEFDDENHSSVLPAAISRAVRLALAPTR